MEQEENTPRRTNKQRENNTEWDFITPPLKMRLPAANILIIVSIIIYKKIIWQVSGYR
jgi:hypothetical protein